METITIEVRSRLRSCNIFISTRDILERSSVKLKLNESVIVLSIAGQTKYIPLRSIKIAPKTLSSLNVSRNWISLRVQTEPDHPTHGSFKTELVGTSNAIGDPNNKSAQVEHRLKEKNCILHCSRCKNEISDKLFFKRVLPLPGENCDPSEWFCCNHNGDDYATLPDPKESDCFYEKHYRVLNKTILKEELILDGVREEVTCNRCLSVLGNWWSTSKKSVKFWNCCVDFKYLDDASTIEKASDPLKDFFLILSDRKDIFTGNRLLIEAFDGDRPHYLLIQLMDQNLELLTEKNLSKLGKDDTIDLATSRVTKLLYKYTEIEAEMKSFSEDVDRCQVALPVMLAAMDHLSTTTKRYPPAYRITDKYFVGYTYV
ncbi:uncharacterized protein LOC105690705 [Athalia rosae]|uniref:uncharacterized protein LOC105690705 n=1 Tax=Athalia rosae TaxID=37344 RepID=UPI0020335DFB|nr:uncharacterized protein LOC105690705 [Athalia rosae]